MYICIVYSWTTFLCCNPYLARKPLIEFLFGQERRNDSSSSLDPVICFKGITPAFFEMMMLFFVTFLLLSTLPPKKLKRIVHDH
jgi:hypothetical protein